MQNLGEAHDKVKLATARSEKGTDDKLRSRLEDAHRKVRKDGEGDKSKIDSALSQVVHLERIGGLRLEQQMTILATSAFYSAILSEFAENCRDSDGRFNATTAYRFHSRLVQAGRIMERTEYRAKVDRERNS